MQYVTFPNSQARRWVTCAPIEPDPGTQLPVHSRNYCMHLVQADRGKSRSACTVDNGQSGIGEIQRVAWRVIHRGILDQPFGPGARKII